MLLALDVGNTNITIGIWDGSHWIQQWRLLTVREKTTDEYGITLTSLVREAELKAGIDQVIMASVVPPLTTTFTRAVQRYLQLTVRLVDAAADTGITVDTDAPEAVGAAAYHLYAGPSITVDMGTATKFDVVSADGRLLGGVIAPGLQLVADALASRAAKLRAVRLEAPPATLGRNTVHAMQSGLVFGYVCLIEGIVERLRQEHPDRGRPMRIFGTGGLIHLIASHTSVIEHVDPWFTLTGLRVIHDRLAE
jgi:type III pantothenate kinase